MKLTIQIPDEQFEQLEAKAASLKVKPETFLAQAVPFTLKYNPREPQIMLEGQHISAIAGALGGKNIKTADEVVKLMKDNFRLSVAGVEYALNQTDAHTLQAQYQGMGFDSAIPYEEYVTNVFEDALSMYLYGSTSGKFAYR